MDQAFGSGHADIKQSRNFLQLLRSAVEVAGDGIKDLVLGI
jgi:hypothetical protein